VHTGVLGEEARPEVPAYKAEIRDDVDEVWATGCRFWQPQAALGATGGLMVDYTYRVPSPFTVVLYKTCPLEPARMDVIALFVQPVTPVVSRAFALVAVIDPQSDATGLTHFQQMIFVQDRAILENQRPSLLPLDPGAEMPTRADLTSIAYRRWLKQKGVVYGTTAAA
jgi:phenylpropionate dioxygenase-like ring-hydroxylating dioxygenase large terminal subunit